MENILAHVPLNSVWNYIGVGLMQMAHKMVSTECFSVKLLTSLITNITDEKHLEQAYS